MKIRTMIPGSLLLGVTLSLAAAGQTAPPAAAVRVDSETISGLGARNIGSATMSGRVAALDAVREGDRLTVFVGAASRRRVEVRQRRHDLQARLRQAARPVDRRRDDRPEEPEGRLGRHRRVLDAQQRLDRRRDLQERRRRRELDERGSRRNGANRRRSSSTRRRATPCTPALPASSGATATSAASTRRPTAARPGRRSSKGSNLSTGCSMISHGPPEPEDALRRNVGLPAQGLDVPLRRRRPRRPERQRPLQVHGRRRDLERARREVREGPAREALGPRRGDGRALEAQRRLRLHRGRRAEERPVPLRRRRRDLAGAGPQPEHGLAALLLRQPDRRPEGREQDLQARPLAHRLDRRRQELHRTSAAGRTATSTTSGSTPTTPTT